MPATTDAVESKDDRERRQRYEDTERELRAVLEAETVGRVDAQAEARWALRESLRLQRRLMDKCLQMKNELVVCALKIKTTEQVQADEIKSLVFYRDECEYSWKQSALSQERERDAMRIIDDLKAKVEDLQLQVKALVANGASASPSRRRPHSEGSSELPLSTLSSAFKAQLPSPTCAGSTVATAISPAKRSRILANGSPGGFMMPPLLSFEEWKTATKVWCPVTPLALGGPSRTTATPSKNAIHALERQQEITRCVSVPSLQPTPMERVSSPQQQQRQQQERLSSIHVPTQSSALISQTSPITRRGGTPAIKRRAPRQLPHVQ
ncbi:hypothetical protein ON010_g11759 [Phytophthora cinnamomi]|nr:hypothetical protein ON010_g11759 [Phytophthora cinnamomi]